jgi:hypothetical protein
MSNDAPQWASFSSAFSIVLRLAGSRIAELGCAPIGDDPKSFVDRGGLRRLERQAASEAVKRVREAAYPLIFSLFGSEMPRDKERKLILTRLGQDLRRIENSLGYEQRSARHNIHEPTQPTPRRARRYKQGNRAAAKGRKK